MKKFYNSKARIRQAPLTISKHKIKQYQNQRQSVLHCGLNIKGAGELHSF